MPTQPQKHAPPNRSTPCFLLFLKQALHTMCMTPDALRSQPADASAQHQRSHHMKSAFITLALAAAIAAPAAAQSPQSTTAAKVNVKVSSSLANSVKIS